MSVPWQDERERERDQFMFQIREQERENKLLEQLVGLFLLPSEVSKVCGFLLHRCLRITFSVVCL